ncbi:MAG: hypothetical protein A2V58_08620 [Candidatus Muproteobacteria bacterium RBG_19FT_COMBO_61_10]|uniref:DUF4340 domain-containing protein n=1 Tax=Candidatus Muproteobacteria bacterium RBG_19FT_COMBO_61_10 TaxID=1817761 RepID=A0A1F6UEG3_9PROT|nr:MAG: hypothetical protein A2V58_08620 [Candidatus Muproteobacteria bacterium RBG_19FT_COMBO_61_10]
MKNRWLLNLALVLLVAVMLAIVVYRPGTPPQPPAPSLTALSADGISRVRVLRPNQPEIVLEKSAGAWSLVAPHKARANLFRVNNLLALATAKSTGHFDAPAADLVNYGLDQAETRVWLNGQEIRFGSRHPINPQVYVMVDNQVHLIAASYFSGAALAPADFFSHQLLDDGLKPVAFSLPGFKLILDSNGAWQMTPANNELGSDRINTLVDEWRHAQALSVNRYSGKPAHEQAVIRFSADSPLKELTFSILAHKPEFVLYRPDEGLEYHFPEAVGTRLLELKPD